MKAFATIFTVLILAAGVVWKLDPFSGGRPVGEAAKGTYVVERQDLKITLSERGTLKTKNSTQIRSRTSAKIEWLIDEGKTVAKDDVLVELDKKDTENQRNQFADQITQLESELKSAETEESIQIDQNKTDLEKAQLTLEVARVELTKLREADIPAEERKLKLAIREKEVGLDDAKDKLAAYEQLRKEDFATDTEVEKARLARERAESDLQTARMEWDNYVKYQRPLDIRKKEAALDEAKRGLGRAEKRAQAQLAAKSARTQQKRVSLSRVKAHLERVQKQLDGMTLKAPTAGTVLYGDPNNRWTTENVKVGGQVWHNMVVITLPDPSEMAVTVEVHEADIAKVKKGMEAFVTSETQKDRIFQGKVMKIDAVANAGRRYSRDNVKRFKVEIALEGKDLGLKTGTSARVEIQIGEVPDVIVVPLQAVFAKEGKHYCFRVEDGKPVRVEVEPGVSNRSHVEIKSGLDEGDEILLYDPEIAGGGDEKEEGSGEEESEGPSDA